MAKRLTISIPEDVHKRLENYRDRIAISSVCAEALRKAMDRIGDNVTKAKRRFWLYSFEEACELAFQKGIEWAGEKATASQLAFLCEWVPDISNNTTLEMLYDNNEIIRKLVEENENPNDYIVENALIEDLVYRFRDEGKEKPITESFRKGAMTVWKEIKSEVVRELLKDPAERSCRFTE